MLLQRLKIALRLMIRQRFFSILNITGLAIGSACFLLIFTYVTDELKFDKFHEHADQLYRVNMTNIWIENNEVFGSTSPGVAKAIRADIPEAKSAVRIHRPFTGTKLVQIEDAVGNIKQFEEDWILAAGDEFFDVFSFPLVSGNQESALDNPNSIVISKTYAAKYFPETEALGKTISIKTGNQFQSFLVTGVAADVPGYSHFDFDMLLSLSSFPKIKRREDSWIWTTFITYVVLDPLANPQEVEKKMQLLPAKYVGEETAAEKNWSLYLQKVTDIHLYSNNIPNRIGDVGSIQNVIIFSTVALLILLLSCINFMNLSTARYADRAKEVGIHKVLGAHQGQIRSQFLLESLIYSFISVILGFGLAELSKGAFNTLSGKSITVNLFENPQILPIMIGLIFTIGLLSGSYPAWFLTRFKPVDVLKGKSKGVKSKSLRNALVVFQFTISIALLGASILVKDQLSFLQNKSLGFNDDNILVMPHMEWMKDNGEVFKNELVSAGLFSSLSLSNSAPPTVWNQDNFIPLQTPGIETLPISTILSDDQFVKTMGLNLSAGRSFFSEGDGDTQSIIINENCAIKLGWMKPGGDSEVVLGRKFAYYDMDNVFTVVGVLEDFNFWNLNIPVEPLAIFHPEGNIFKERKQYLLGRLNTSSLQNLQQNIEKIENVWNKLNPTLPFQYSFMDKDFDAAFGSERRFGQVLDTFTVLAILIAVLGLVGLISFTTEQRTKEFGIRKVMGASMNSLIKLIAMDFTKLLTLGFLIGSVLCWYYGSMWLDNFFYRTPISPMVFIIAAGSLFVLIIAITTFIIQKNGRRNPAEILRDE